MEEALAAAREIAAELAARDFPDGSLAGSSGAWLLAHQLGEPVAPALVQRWEDAAVAALPALPARLFDGMIGAAWMLAVAGRAGDELAAVDEAVLELLHEPWQGGLASFGGGLAGFGIYGLARGRARRGRAIVARCVAHLAALAQRDGRAVRWSPTPALPRLFNREGSAGAVAFLGAATRAKLAAARSLAARGAATLAADLERASDPVVGVATAHATSGLVHGAGTWALGTAGAVSALLSAGHAAASRVGRALADLDPETCDARDASLGAGSAGILYIMQALAERTRQPVFRFAVEHWVRRTLRYTMPAPPGLFEGAAGTALALLCAARGTRAAPALARCLLA